MKSTQLRKEKYKISDCLKHNFSSCLKSDGSGDGELAQGIRAFAPPVDDMDLVTITDVVVHNER